LLLGLTEGSDDLIVGPNTSLNLYLVETIFNDFDIPHIHIHQSFFLFIVSEPLAKPAFQDLNRIRERRCFRHNCSDSCLSLLRGSLLVFVPFLQLFLQLHYLHLKDKFIMLVLSLQRKNLIVSLFKVTLTHHYLLINLLAVVNRNFDLLVVTVIDKQLLPHLLPHHVNLPSLLSISCLQV